MGITSKGKIEAGVYVGAGEMRTIEGESKLQLSSSVPIWHHAAASYNGSSFALYLNGTLDAIVHFSHVKSPREVNKPLTIGHGFDGWIDEVSSALIDVPFLHTNTRIEKAVPLHIDCGMLSAPGVPGYTDRLDGLKPNPYSYMSTIYLFVLQVRILPEYFSETSITQRYMCPTSRGTELAYFTFNEGGGSQVMDISEFYSIGLFIHQKPKFSEYNAPSGVGVIDPTTSIITSSLSENSSMATGANITFQISLKDQCGFDLSFPEDDYIQASVVISSESSNIANTDDSVLPSYSTMSPVLTAVSTTPCLGVRLFETQVTAPQCGTLEVALMTDEAHIADSPYQFTVLPMLVASSETSTVSIFDGIAQIEVPVHFTITAYDENGCLRTSGGDDFRCLVSYIRGQAIGSYIFIYVNVIGHIEIAMF